MIKKSCVCLPEEAGCIPLAVVMMTTANEYIRSFPEMHTQLFIVSDLNRSLPALHGDCRGSLDPCYVKSMLLGDDSHTIQLSGLHTVQYWF